MNKAYIVVPDGLAKDKYGKTLSEPSFVYRQVLDYLLKILNEDSIVYLAPANKFDGELHEQEVGYNYLKARTKCNNIYYYPVYNGYGYIDTYGNAYLLKKYLIKIDRWPLHAADLVCANIHSYRAEYCFKKLGYRFDRVHRVQYQTSFNESIVDRLMMLQDNKGVYSTRRFLLANIFAMFSVLTRQIYAWIIGVGLFSALFYGSRTVRSKLKNGTLVLIPIASLVPFLIMWNGLTPPAFQEHQAALFINPDVAVYVVSLLGLYGAFFFLWCFHFFREGDGKIRHIILILSLSVVFLLIYPVSYSRDLYRWGGALWTFSRFMPNFFSTSIAFWVLFPLGSLFVYVVVLSRKSNKDYFIIVCAILWLVANMSSRLVFQRYYDPFLLFFIGYSLRQRQSEPWYYWIGPTVLLSGFIGVDLFYKFEFFS